MNFWTTFAAVCAGAIPVIGMIATLTVWFVRSTVRQEIADGNALQLRQINGTYIKALGATLTGAEIERNLAEIKGECRSLRDAHDELGRFCHDNIDAHAR